MPNRKITAPKKTTIKGQPHELAYINDAEQGLLMALGGSGKKVNGIPAFFDVGEGSGGYGSPGAADYGESDEDRDQDREQDIAAAAAAAQGVDMSGFGFDDDFDPTSRDTARDVYDTMMNIRTATGSTPQAARDQILGYAQNQIQNRQQQAQNLMRGYPVSLFGQNFNIPNAFGIGAGLLSKFNLSRINSALQNPEAIPAFDTTGKLEGAYTPGLFGIGEVYTGANRGPMFDGEGGPEDEVEKVVPPNPLTGVCPEGYKFDDDLQACRLDNDSAEDTSDPITSSADGLMYRPTALDQAPAFGGDGFADANRQFVESFAYNPDFYDNQMDLTGFVPVRGLLG
jgi:hypothetical protein